MYKNILGTSTLEGNLIDSQNKLHTPLGLAGRNGFGAADIHVHSTASDGMASVAEILEFVAERGDLDVIAVTDHGEISGGYEARELAAKHNYPFEVIVGMEINTREGHLLALFLENPVANNQPLTDTIAAVHSQGGLCIAPHPMSPFSESINHKDMVNILHADNPEIYFDGIETFNATIMGSVSNHRARNLNEKYKLAETGGSDAHFLISISSGLTLFPGRTAEDFRRSILERTTMPMKGHTPSYFEIGLMQILKQQRKSGSFFFRGIIKNAARVPSKMKIALVSPYDFAHPGGVENHITFLYKELIKTGHEVRIITPYSGNSDSLENKDIITIGRPVPISSAGSIARITLLPTLSSPVKAVLEREKFDIIHLHDPLYSMLTLTVLRHSKSTNIGTFHAFQNTRIPYHLISPLFQTSFDRLHGRIAVSEPAKRFISQYFPSEYTIIPNGIDFKRFSTPLSPIEKLRDGKLNILFVGRAEKRKGLNFLLEAYQLIKREIPQSRLVIVGPETQQKYEHMAGKMALEDVVFTGYVPNEALPAYYQTCDVFCSPATGGESFGIVLLEAMAASRAIVASSIDGYASLMSNDIEGLMVPPKDVTALANAIITLLKDEPRRLEMGLQGLRKAEQYSWTNVAKTINEYYICIHNKLKC